MNPIEKLMDEHQNILKGLTLLEKGSNLLESGTMISSDFFGKMIDFIRNYADRYHHAKEEDILFIRMGKAGFPTDQGPVAVMLSEHDEGRGYVAGLEKANRHYAGGDESAAGEMVENARAYIYLLRQHISKEDNILYPMAENILGPSGIESLQPDFGRVEKEKAGIEKKYLDLIGELESELEAAG